MAEQLRRTIFSILESNPSKRITKAAMENLLNEVEKLEKAGIIPYSLNEANLSKRGEFNRMVKELNEAGASGLPDTIPIEDLYDWRNSNCPQIWKEIMDDMGGSKRRWMKRSLAKARDGLRENGSEPTLLDLRKSESNLFLFLRGVFKKVPRSKSSR